MTEPALCSSLAAYGLAGAVMELPREPLDRSAWQRLTASAVSHQVDGFLAAAVADGALPAREAQKAAIERFQVERMSACLTLEAALVNLVDLLGRAEIPVLVLRGAGTAHLDYSNPAMRPFGDIDILVPPGLRERAVATLRANGFAQVTPRKVNSGWEAPCVALASPGRLEVDLYEHVIGGPWATTVSPAQLWANASPFTLAGTAMAAPGPEVRLISTCLWVSIGPAARLITMRDVAQMVLGGQIDVDRARHLARQWGVQAALAQGVRQAWETFALADVLALSTWARRHRPTASELDLLEAYRRASSETTSRSGQKRRLRIPIGARSGRMAGAWFR